MKRKTLLALLASCALSALAAPAVAQDYPARPIRIIVPLAPGGGTDVLARVVAQKMREKFNQTVTVENRPGAAGNIGADFVAKAPGDGYTLLFTQPAPLVVNKFLYEKLPYDPSQFVPIGIVSLQDMMLAVNPAVPARDVKELLAYAKANPGRLNYGSSGAGSAPHLAAELLGNMAGLKMVHVPYKGSAESQTATVGGQVDLTFFAFSSALPHVKAGRLRPIAVGSPRRNPALPDVPSMSEFVPGYVATSWTALVAPPGTPAAVVQKLSQALTDIVKMPDVHARLLDAGDQPFEGSRADMEAFIREEARRWGTLIQAEGITNR